MGYFSSKVIECNDTLFGLKVDPSLLKFQTWRYSVELFQHFNSNCLSMKLILIELPKVLTQTNDTTLLPRHPALQFSTCHPRLMYNMSFYLDSKSVGLFQHFFLNLSPSNKFFSSPKHSKLSSIAKYTPCTVFSC